MDNEHVHPHVHLVVVPHEGGRISINIKPVGDLSHTYTEHGWPFIHSLVGGIFDAMDVDYMFIGGKTFEAVDDQQGVSAVPTPPAYERTTDPSVLKGPWVSNDVGASTAPPVPPRGDKDAPSERQSD